MIEAPPQGPSITWSELSQHQTAVTEDWESMKAWREKAGIRIH
jgi:hypothetical protein